MQAIGNLFNIVLFVTMAGSLFTLALLFAKKVLHLVLPLWFGVLGAAFFLIPFIVPQVQLVPPEKTLWIYGYKIACMVWASGAVLFLLYYSLRGLFAYRAIKKYPACKDERVYRIYTECGAAIRMKQMPELRFGSLKDPACVVTLLHPTVIVNEDIVRQLTDSELQIVLSHELTHIKRNHHLFQHIYDLSCCLNWFNPFIWIAKNDFSLSCEMDCDAYTLQTLTGKKSSMDYATAMLRLLELSAGPGKAAFGRIDALGFLLVKQRFSNILNKPSKKRRIVTMAVLTLFAVLVIAFSTMVSRTYFYPYPALMTPLEYRDSYTGR